MKKILLSLLMMVSVSFASAPEYVTYNGLIFKLAVTNLGSLSGKKRLASCPTPQLFVVTFANADGSGVTYMDFDVSCVWDSSYTSNAYYTFNNTYGYSRATDCESPKKVVDGQCVAPDECDPIGAKYTSSTTGKCVDCMPFTSFNQRASCACDSQGSTYTPQATTTYDYFTADGGYTYKKTNAMCDNGTRVAVYYEPVSNTPTDNNNTNPTDNNNTTPPKDTNSTTPTDGNNTKPTTPTQADVVKAVNDSTKTMTDSIKSSSDALKVSTDAVKVSVDSVKSSVDSVKTSTDAVKSSVDTSNTKLDSLVSKLSDANLLAGDSKAIQKDIKTALNSEFAKNDKARSDLDARLKNLIDAQLGASASLNWIASNTADTTRAVNGTTNAVNTQGDKLGGKLDDILKAIKDGNGTDMQPTNDLLEKIKGDTNATAKGVDTLHNDLNTTNEYIKRMLDFFDSNSTVDTNRSGSSLTLNDMLPEGGESWFTSHTLDLRFNNYGGDCYCQTAEFTVAGKTFVFPPQEALDVIPFTTISNIFMAFIYVLGLKSFLRN